MHVDIVASTFKVSPATIIVAAIDLSVVKNWSARSEKKEKLESINQDWKNFWVELSVIFAQVVSSWSYRWFSLLLGAPYLDVLTARGKDLRHASPVRWSSVLLSIIDISAPRLHQQVMKHLDGNNHSQLYNVKKGPE